MSISDIVNALEVCRLEKEIAIVKAENVFLKEAITDILIGEKVKIPKTLPTVQLQKWAYYREHKDEIAQQISRALGIPADVISWCVVKRKSDEMFHRSLEHTLKSPNTHQEEASSSTTVAGSGK